MENKENLETLLEVFESPKLVAEHLGVSITTLYEAIKKFQIPLRYPRHDHAELRRRIEEIRKEMPGISSRKLQQMLGVSKDTILRVLRQDRGTVAAALPPAERPLDSREGRLRSLLEQHRFPRLVAAEMGLQMADFCHLMIDYGLKLPAYNAAQRTRAIRELLQDIPDVPPVMLSTITGIHVSTISKIRRINLAAPSSPPPPPPSSARNYTEASLDVELDDR